LVPVQKEGAASGPERGTDVSPDGRGGGSRKWRCHKGSMSDTRSSPIAFSSERGAPPVSSKPLSSTLSLAAACIGELSGCKQVGRDRAYGSDLSTVGAIRAGRCDIN